MINNAHVSLKNTYLLLFNIVKYCISKKNVIRAFILCLFVANSIAKHI
jgi:hypothetical protein